MKAKMMGKYRMLLDNEAEEITSEPLIHDNKEAAKSEELPIRLYKQRYWNLVIFSLNIFSNSLLYTYIAGINETASKYYRVRSSTLNWVPNSFLLVYVIAAIPSSYGISRYGLKASLLTSSSLNGIATCLHFAGNDRDGFPELLTGQIFAALASVIALQLPSKIATTWFAANEHAVATSIGYLMNILGGAFGYLMSTQMVSDTDDMNAVEEGIFNMHITQMICSVVTLFLTFLAFAEKPPVPPSHTAALNETPMAFSKSMKMLLEDRDYKLLSQGYGLVYGLSAFFGIVLNKMVASRMTGTAVGWMGFSCNIFGIFGMLLFAVLLDKYKSYRLIPIILLSGSLLIWIGFTLTLLLSKLTVLLFCFLSLLGFFSIPFISVGIERGTVIAYPVPEETSAGIMLIFGNLYGFILVLVFGSWVDKGKIDLICYVNSGLFVIAFALVCLSRVKLSKLDVEGPLEFSEKV